MDLNILCIILLAFNNRNKVKFIDDCFKILMDALAQCVRSVQGLWQFWS